MSRYLTGEPIAVERLISLASGPENGGTAVFIGTVRAAPEDGPVTAIEYSAYPEMVEREMDSILEEARSRWPQAKFSVQHRTGVVPLGEASVVVVTATPHRDAAFAACRYVIEEIKHRLPVWKKEHLSGGESRWREHAG